MRTALVTGAAGFTGSHLVDQLLAEGWYVIGIDNFDPSYDPAIKEHNIARHRCDFRFKLIYADIRDFSILKQAIRDPPDVIVHLAAKAGVRPSIADPLSYYDVNVRGTQNLLELARCLSVRHFVFASSSSVYGMNQNIPWSEDEVLMPISPYAATKVTGEIMGRVYANLHGIRFIGLRFFTVYGPRQRPDLAIHRFSALLREGKPLHLFGSGQSGRSYTFIDDCIKGIIASLDYVDSHYEIFNIGDSRTTSLIELVAVLEEVSGLHANVIWMPDQSGDVPVTSADPKKTTQLLGCSTQTELRTGLRIFWDWLTAG